MSAFAIDRALLATRLAELETARAWPPGRIDALKTLIETADDEDLFRVNPHRFAAARAIPGDEAIDLFLHATKIGLFEIEWQMICAFCGHVVKSLPEVAKVHSHFICDFCGGENDVAVDDYIHVGFTLSPQVRRIAFLDPDSLSIEDYYIKYHFVRGIIFPGDLSVEEVGGLLTRLMTYLEPGAEVRFEADLGPGALQIKDLRNAASLTVLLADGAGAATAAATVTLRDGGFRVGDAPPAPTIVPFRVAPFHFQIGGELAGAHVSLAFVNALNTRSALWVMYYPAGFESDYVRFDSFLSGKTILTNQTFRDLFRFAASPIDEAIDVRDITFLFTDLKGSTELYERIGDLKAYALVRQHFETLTEVIARHHGAIVKTIGDAVMATFMNPADATAAAVAILRDIEAFNATISDAVILKIGIHAGPAIVVTLNDRIDYFGQTVNIAARVQGLAGAGEIVISDAACRRPGVGAALAGCEVVPQQASLKGVSTMVDVHKITLCRP